MSLNMTADVIFIFSAIGGLLMVGAILGELSIIRKLMETKQTKAEAPLFKINYGPPDGTGQ